MTVPNGNTTPSTSPMASGGQIVIDVSGCAGFGGIFPENITTATGSTVSADSGDDLITYSNSGNGATTDTFTFENPDTSITTVTVLIAPHTSPITISPDPPAAPAIATPYSQTFTGGGGISPYTVSITGSLPPGLSASGGTLSGTPTQVGTYSISVTVTDSTTPTALTNTQSFQLVVPTPTLSLSSGTPAAGTINIAYSQLFTATGGTGPYQFSTTGALPPGLSLSSSGQLSGTPTQTGSWTFPLTFTDEGTTFQSGNEHVSGTQSVTITINAAPTILIGPATLTAASVGSAYSQSETATGGTAPYQYALTGGALPNGLTLNASSGVISGTPTASGTFNFTLQATDKNNFTGTQAVTLTVNAVVPGAPTIGTATPGDAQVSVAFTAPASTGGASITEYTVTSSPGGFTANGASSPIVVSGLSNGTAYTFTVTATNSVGTGAASAASTSVTPRHAQTIAFAQPSSQNFGTTPTLSANASSGLPVSFSSSTGSVCSITSGGQLSFLTAGTCTINADQAGNGTYQPAPTVTQSFSVAAVVPGAPTIGTATPGTRQASVTFTAPTSTGGASITGYTVTSSPGGISTSGPSSPLTVTGLSNGTAYTFTVTATNSVGTGAPSAASTSVTPQGTQAITFNNPGPQNFGTTPTLLANASSGLTVNFSSSTGSVCSITSAGLLNFLTAGTCTISADQAGNGAYQPAPTVTQSFSVTAVVPGAPTIGTATAGVAQVSVAFTAPASTGGASITEYTVTSSPGGVSNTGAASPIVVSGLNNGTAYTFTVTATNSVGAGAPSAASTSVTPQGTQTITFVQPPSQNFGTTPMLSARASSGLTVSFSSSTGSVCSITSAGLLNFLTAGTCTISADQAGNGAYQPAPTVTQSFVVNPAVAGAPGIGAATAADSQATVTFTPPSNTGGITITGYTVTSSPGGISASGSASPITVSHLSNGTAYTFTVTANNTAGTGPASAASNSVTPQGTQTITFNNPGSVNFGATPTLVATASSGLAVAFSSGSTSICTITLAGVLTTVAGGTCVINADQAGNGTYLAATRVTQSFTIVALAPVITTTTLPAPILGTAYSQTIAASGNPSPFTFAVTGSLPPGLVLNPTSGTLTGQATAAGTFTFVVSATDALNLQGTQSYTVTIIPATLTLSPASVPNAVAEAAYSQTFTASGGTAPYRFSHGVLPPGLSLDPVSGLLSGTPTAAGAYSVSVTATDSSTGTGAPFVVTQNYNLTIHAPSISVGPASLPNAQSGVAYSQSLSASGGNGSYGFSVSAGALPPGLVLSAAGLLSGTPTAAGSYSFTVTAKDGLNFTGSEAYTLSIGQPVPVVQNESVSMPADSPMMIAVTTKDVGPITSITIAQQPTHGTATVSGLAVIYTPNNNYYGSDSFTYTATGPGGTSLPATVALTVTPLAVPAVPPQSVTVLAGKAVTIQGAQGATGGPFTTLTIVTQPSSGTASVSGTNIVYTPPSDASGAVIFAYTLSNAFGVSQPANVTVTVNPLPIPAALSASVLAGSSVQVDLTSAAHGGPFTGAAVVSIAPANAGTATVHSAGSGYALNFTASATFSGVAQLSYTLSNAYATSSPATVSLTVTARPDPSKDAEVLGVLNAQVDATRRMATGQINNFQSRLESLHGDAAQSGFINGITFSSAGNQQNRDPLLSQSEGNSWNRRYLVQPNEPVASSNAASSGTSGGTLPGGITVWTGGAANFGKTQPGTSDNGIDFTTAGLSVGADKRVNDSLALGVGLGYGHDDSDVGQHGSRSTVNSYNVAAYASYQPYPSIYADALVGYQWLSFDARRYVTSDGSMANGSRDGGQLFGSLSLGYEHRSQDMLLSPYARLDVANAKLDAYTEQGIVGDTLSYQRQTVKTTTGNLGLRAEWSIKRDYGVWMPSLRVEYEHDFEGSSQAVMRYADLLGGPLYQAALDDQSRNHTLLGAGIQLQTLNSWRFRFEYQNLLDNNTRDNQSILLGVEKQFRP